MDHPPGRLAATVLSAIPFTELPTVRLIVLGGEALHYGPLDQWLSRYRLANAYGPTETTLLVHNLALHKIDDLFDIVVNSADIAVCKPAPAAFRIAAAHMGLPLHSIAFTDDNPTNTDSCFACPRIRSADAVAACVAGHDP